jgi:hypothetical protein
LTQQLLEVLERLDYDGGAGRERGGGAELHVEDDGGAAFRGVALQQRGEGRVSGIVMSAFAYVCMYVYVCVCMYVCVSVYV